MKILKKIVVVTIILLIIMISAASLYFKKYGKDMIQNALEVSLKRDVMLEDVYYAFPLKIRIRNVQINHDEKDVEFFKADAIVAQLSFKAITQRKFIFDSVTLIEPSISMEYSKTIGGISSDQDRRYGVVIPPGDPELPVAEEVSVISESQEKSKSTEIIINHLIVKEGYIHYAIDLTEKNFSFDLDHVFIKTENLTLPLKPGRSKFDMTASLIKEGSPLSGNNVRSYGWVDLVQRDMEEKIEVIEDDGTVVLMVNMVSRNNDMKVDGEIKMQDLFSLTKNQTTSSTENINNLVLNAMSSSGAEIGAKFAFKTKMDDFRPEKISFSGNVVTK